MLDSIFDGKLLNKFEVRWQQDLSQSLNGSLEEIDVLSQAVLNGFRLLFCGIVAVVPPVVGGLLFYDFFWKG
ncbi:MAG: hypothetical protein HZA46_00440 [Planctomycetales bacterium]|nr:hypothetical protein [Planctomycetales bacterium]